jgi:hypothetical protein
VEKSNKPSLLERIKDHALGHLVWLGFTFIGGGIAIYFGKPHLLQALGFENPIAAFIDSEQSQDANQGTQPSEAVKEVTKAEDDTPEVGAANVGFTSKSKYMGFKSEFIVLEPGPCTPPFVEVRSGQHDLNWSVQVSTKKGGLLGFGGEAKDWKLSGIAKAEFLQSSLYALLKEGQADFLKEIILPLMEEAAQEAIKSIDVDKLMVETPQESEETTEENQGDKLKAVLLEKFNEVITEDYSIVFKETTLDTPQQLSLADLSTPNLKKLESKELFRIVQEAPSKLQDVRNSSIGEKIAIFFFMAVALVIMLVFKGIMSGAI